MLLVGGRVGVACEGRSSPRREDSASDLERVGFLSSRFCAAAAGSALAAFAYPAGAAETAPPLVQGSATAEVSLAYFEQRLTPFGHWFQHPVWGEVWQPNTGPTFRPYFYGYWQYTADYGWLWVSNEPYGDIVYHYGRWMF